MIPIKGNTPTSKEIYHALKQINMQPKNNTMNKRTLIEWIEKRGPIVPARTFLEQLVIKINQLPDDGEITQGKGEPEQSLPLFMWPVPDGMDVVTHDGIKVNDYCKPDQYCTVPVVIGGHWHMYDMSRLFLRPVPPEMIEAWYCMETGWVTSDEVVKQAWANNQTVASVQFPKPKGI